MSVINNDEDYLCIDKELGITLVHVDLKLADEEWENKQYKEIVDDITIFRSMIHEFGDYISIQQEDIDRLEKSIYHTVSNIENNSITIDSKITEQPKNEKYLHYVAYVPIAVSVTVSVTASVVAMIMFGAFN